MVNPGDAIQARLQALRDSYSAQLPGKLDEIRSYWQRVATQGRQEDIRTLHRLVHSLTGSGATFGYAGLSDASRVLEVCLKEVMDHDRALDTACRRAVELYLDAITRYAGPQGGADRALLSVDAHAPPSDTDNRLVFLVEDDAGQAEELALRLRHFGYAVRIFAEPAAACEAIGTAAPAAVIMDVMFPEGSLAGPMAIRQIKASCPAPPPVLFVSSRDDLQARLEAVRACGDGYFVKPVDLHALIDRLDRLTAQRPPEAYRVLIVDDDATLADHYALTLRQAGMEVMTINHPLDVLEALAGFKPDLILLDLYMPECDGLELAAVLRQLPDYLGIPIVFLSTEVDVDLHMQAMRLGADDFLSKPIKPAYLAASVESRAQRARVLRSRMIRDSLTGLLNHTTTKDYLALEFTRARRQNWPMAFAIIDLDHFKSINDTQGHATGDRVLKSLARLLQQRLRKSDIIGRVGGEEFAVIFTDTDGTVALHVMEGIRSAFEAVCQQGGAAEFSASFSCGIAVADGRDSAGALYQAADDALYRAKEAGRNRVILG